MFLLNIGDTESRLRFELLDRKVADLLKIAAINGDLGPDPGGDGFRRFTTCFRTFRLSRP